MKLFRRFRRIVGSRISDKLDRFEDPEKMIRYMVREIEDTLTKAKSETTAKIATLKMIEREREDVSSETKRWAERAELAVGKGKDDLARQAIAEKQKVAQRLTLLDSEVAQMESIISQMQDHVHTLELKRDEVIEKQRILIQRAYHAKEKKKLMESLKALDSSTTVRRFNELEETIGRLEAEASLAEEETQHISAEQKFSRMEADEAVEDELKALKKKLST